MAQSRVSIWIAALAASAALWAAGGMAQAQPLGEAGLAGAESVRLSVVQARIGAQQQALQAEQNEFQKQYNAALLPQAVLASRAAALKARAAQLQANMQVANADIMMTRAALAKAPSPGGFWPEVSGKNLTWVLTAKGAYFATPGRDWIYYDKDQPLRETVLTEISAAAAFVVLLDPKTNLRRAIDTNVRTVAIQLPPNGMSELKEPIISAGSDVHGQNVMRVTYPSGSFEQRSPGIWIERQRGRTFATFSELKRTRELVQLLDQKRDLQLFVSISSGQILFSTSDRPVPKSLYPIQSMTARYVPPGPVIDYVE